ncbi:hypothetical protein [Pseudonocardia sp. TRM90224]|uniref:hypothetical protein n=1 Tax=Pseudonocardia sp. TRM90224 TaxID=2812678 RepID=UPI001E5DA93B|nr:hypothetical protein [Pseudonocardia sp. TRM90224]
MTVLTTRVQAPPRWAVRAAHVIPLLTLPTALWRLAWVFAIPIGWDATLYQQATDDLHEKAYLLGLALLAEGLALLALGLVQPWGEVVPRRVPGLGGRRIPPMAAVVPATFGAIALTVMWGATPLMFFLPPQAGAPDGNGWEALMAVCYLPLTLWGPLLGAVTWSYYRRRVRCVASGSAGRAGKPLSGPHRA